MLGLKFRRVGTVRTKANIALTNLVYNMCRYSQILRFAQNGLLRKYVTKKSEHMLYNIIFLGGNSKS